MVPAIYIQVPILYHTRELFGAQQTCFQNMEQSPVDVQILQNWQENTS